MDIVIFGTQPFARLAWYALTHESEHRVVAFTVHRAHLREPQWLGLPVVPFEELAGSFSPATVGMCVALGWSRMNGLRRDIAAAAERAGYRLVSHVSPRAIVWPDLSLGRHCLVFEGAIIQPFARVGDNCIVRAGANLSHDVQVGSDCFIAGNAMVGGGVWIGPGSVVGMGAVLRDRVQVAPGTFVGAGAVVTADIAEPGVYVGVPARRTDASVDEVTRERRTLLGAG